MGKGSGWCIVRLKEIGIWPERRQRQVQYDQDIPAYWPTKPKKNQPVSYLKQKYYYYHPASGHLIGITGRYEREKNGKPQKEVVPFFCKFEKTGKWKSGLGQYREKRPWYCLHKLHSRVKKLIVVEGEKCTNTLNNLKLADTLAVCWQGGSKAHEKIDYSVLIETIRRKGKELQQIYFWPDSDLGGVRAMHTIWKKIRDKINLSFFVVNPHPLLKPCGWDVADFLQQTTVKFDRFEDIEQTGLIRIKEANQEVFDIIMLEAEIVEMKIEYLRLEYEIENASKDKKTQLKMKEKKLERDIEDKINEYMNYNYAFVVDGQVVFIDKENNKIIPKQSLDMLLANLQLLNFNPIKTWIEHPYRQTFHGITLSRQTPTGAMYNLFKGWNVQPKPNLCTNFLSFIHKVICNGNNKIYEWILDWLAQLFQLPERVKGKINSPGKGP